MRQSASQRRDRADDRAERIGELLIQHRAKVIVVVVILAMLVGGGWFYRRSLVLKEERSELAYSRARQAVDAGNYALAESDLRTVVERYPGTNGGSQAALWLATVMYQQGRHDEGLAVLRQYQGSISRHFVPDMHVLLAAGHESLGQFVEAAAEYEQAAAAARFPEDQKSLRASAARAYTAGGRSEEALAIWRELEADPEQTVAAEARVRIGELTARTPEGGGSP